MRKLALLIVLLILAAGAAWGFFSMRTREPYRGYTGPEQFVDIPPGATTKTIGRLLVASGVKARLNWSTIRRTRSAAFACRDKAYVSGKRYPSRSRAAGSNARTRAVFFAASTNSALVPKPCDSKIAAISPIVSPSGIVRGMA